MKIELGTDGGPGHVYSSESLVTVENGIVTRKMSGLTFWTPNRPFTADDARFGYGEPWAKVDGVVTPYEQALALALQ